MRNLMPLLLCITILLSSCSRYATEYIPMRNDKDKLNYTLTLLVRNNSVKVGGIFTEGNENKFYKLKYKLIETNADKDNIPKVLKVPDPKEPLARPIFDVYLPILLPYLKLPFPFPTPGPCRDGIWVPLERRYELEDPIDLPISSLPSGTFKKEVLGLEGLSFYTNYQFSGKILTVVTGYNFPK